MLENDTKQEPMCYRMTQNVDKCQRITQKYNTKHARTSLVDDWPFQSLPYIEASAADNF